MNNTQSTRENKMNTSSSASCVALGLMLASIALNFFLIAGCSSYARALRTLAEEQEGGFVNPLTASNEADRLKLKVERRLQEVEKDLPQQICAARAKGFEEGKQSARDTMRVKYIERLSRIADMVVDVRDEDALDKTIANIERRIEKLEKSQGDDAVRPRRLMRDIASKLGVAVNEKMGLNDLYSRIAEMIETEVNVPNTMPENEFKDALNETTWKKEFDDYHQFIKKLNGKRIIIVPASR